MQTGYQMAHAGSSLKPTDCLERHRLESQPSSRTILPRRSDRADPLLLISYVPIAALPWCFQTPHQLRHARVRGKVDFYDGLERVSSQTLLDLLEVPQRKRTAATFRRLAKVMAELGWTAVRVRDLTRGADTKNKFGPLLLCP
jgi:hypothetical protein